MNHVIIVAGGSGQRMASAVPKQFLPLGGRPILMRTIERFAAFDPAMDIIVVLPQSQTDYWQRLCHEHRFGIGHRTTAGGATRYESVRNGLALVDGEGLVGIHDGVRPLVSQPTLELCYAMAATHGNAIPACDSVDSVRMLKPDGSNTAADRTCVKLVQTPQVFDVKLIKQAYQLGYRPTFTDDASVAEAAGIGINLTEGNRENIKITTPVDLLLAEAILNEGENRPE